MRSKTATLANPAAAPASRTAAGLAVLAIACWLATPAVNGAEAGGDADGPSRRWSADLSYGLLSGDYGTGEESDLEVMTTRVRWTLPRGEVRLSLPYLHLTGSGNLTLTPGGPIGNGNGNAHGNSNGNGNGPSGGTQGVDEPAADIESTDASGIGDLRLRGEWHALTGGRGRPWVSLLADVKAPTAADALGTGETDFTGGLGLVQPLSGRHSLLADAGYTWMGDPEGVDYGNVVSVGVGASRKLGSRGGRHAFAYLEHRSHPIRGRDARVDMQLGASARLGDERHHKISGSILFGLSDTAEDVGAVVSYGRTF